MVSKVLLKSTALLGTLHYVFEVLGPSFESLYFWSLRNLAKVFFTLYIGKKANLGAPLFWKPRRKQQHLFWGCSLVALEKNHRTITCYTSIWLYKLNLVDFVAPRACSHTPSLWNTLSLYLLHYPSFGTAGHCRMTILDEWVFGSHARGYLSKSKCANSSQWPRFELSIVIKTA